MGLLGFTATEGSVQRCHKKREDVKQGELECLVGLSNSEGGVGSGREGRRAGGRSSAAISSLI